jgi:hypothetical protein
MEDGSNDGGNERGDIPGGGGEDEREYPADRLWRRLEAKLGGRPLMVYLVLIAGAAVLLLLLAIVWISATGNKNPERPPCFDIDANAARDTILAGKVDRIEIFLDRQRPELGPSAIRLDYSDNTCRELPKGADNVTQAYVIVGVVDVYNNIHDAHIRVTYHRTPVQPEFLVTSTPTPTVTPTPTLTPLPTETPIPTQTPASPPA